MVLKSVSAMSAGKIMGALGALGGLIGGAMLAIFSLLGGAIQQQAGGGNAQLPAMFVGVGAIVLLPILYGIVGFIGGMIYALLYNLVAGFVGGLELELEPRSPQY